MIEMKKKLMKSTIFLMGFISFGVFASTKGILGTWETIDDRTGQKKAIVQLYEKDGKIEGKIQHVYWKKGDNHICVNCKGELKNRPIEGLRFLWDMDQHSKHLWESGYILDPHNGMVYRAKLKQQGQSLYVRAYLGIPMLGRTQQWHRHQEGSE